jgi:hypothetical protein
MIATNRSKRGTWLPGSSLGQDMGIAAELLRVKALGKLVMSPLRVSSTWKFM